MSIATDITRIQNAKTAIKTAIENKGVTVPESTKIDGYSALIDEIETGGGSKNEPITITANGVYTAPNGVGYSPVNVNLQFEGNKFQYFINNHQGDGQPSCYEVFTDFKGTDLSPIVETIDTSECTDFGKSFYGCTNLTSIPLLNTTNGTKFSSMYYNCSKCTTFPSINTSKGTNFSSMHKKCSALRYYPSYDLSNAENTSYMFDECGRIKGDFTFDLPKCTNAQDMFSAEGDITDLEATLTIKNTNKLTTMEGFCQRHGFKEVIIESLPLLESMSYSFSAWSNLPIQYNKLILPDLPSIKEMSCAFKNCTINEQFTIGDFTHCTNLYETFMNFTLGNNIANKEIIIGNLPNVSNLSMSFYNSNFEHIKIGNIEKCTYGSSTFENCKKLKKLEVGSLLDKFKPSYFARGCPLLEEVILENISGGSDWFATDYSLKKLVIKTMETLPTISSNYFASCYHFTGTTDATYNPQGLKDGRIYVPDDKVEELKAATNWSVYADIIVPLSTLVE